MLNNIITRWFRRASIHMFHALNPVSRRKAVQWENSAGVGFLRVIGVKECDVVIDFGCGTGSFCIWRGLLYPSGLKSFRSLLPLSWFLV